MKKILILLACILCIYDSLLAAGFSKIGKVGDLQIQFESENPLAIGDNKVTIKLLQKGIVKTDASVKLIGQMPEAHGESAIKDEFTTTKKGDRYVAEMKFSKTGGWNIIIEVKDRSGKTKKYSFMVMI